MNQILVFGKQILLFFMIFVVKILLTALISVLVYWSILQIHNKFSKEKPVKLGDSGIFEAIAIAGSFVAVVAIEISKLF